jgi:multicomponent Na+:H+ antiporter subunit G
MLLGSATAHALARAAYKAGVPMWHGSVTDEPRRRGSGTDEARQRGPGADEARQRTDS